MTPLGSMFLLMHGTKPTQNNHKTDQPMKTDGQSVGLFGQMHLLVIGQIKFMMVHAGQMEWYIMLCQI